MDNNYNNYNTNNVYNSSNMTNNDIYNHNNQNNKSILIFIVITFIIVFLLSFVFLKTETNTPDDKNKVEELTNVKKEKMVQTIDSYITAAVYSVNNYDFGPLSDSTVLYYIPVSNIKKDSCISLEKNGESSLGDWEKAYVAVSYNPSLYSYDYYFTFITVDGYQMSLTKSTDIRKDGTQIVKSNHLDESNITTQLNERSSTTKVLITPAEAPGYLENVKSCHSSNTKTNQPSSNTSN